MTSDPASTARLFVYGTLLPGYGNHRKIESHVRSARPGTIQGILVDLGAFPALLHGEGIVRGVVLEVDAEALSISDSIEGYHPDRSRSLYIREEVQVDLDDDSKITAWTYFFANPIQIEAEPRLQCAEIDDQPVYCWPVE